jgi:hypothetical protein
MAAPRSAVGSYQPAKTSAATPKPTRWTGRIWQKAKSWAVAPDPRESESTPTSSSAKPAPVPRPRQQSAPLGDGPAEAAFGLQNPGEHQGMLDSFAAKVNAKTYGEVYGTWSFPKVARLEVNVRKMMQNSPKLHFNLDNMDMGRFRQFAKKPALSDHNITNWELHTILSDKSLLGKTTFYRGGKVVPAPDLH